MHGDISDVDGPSDNRREKQRGVVREPFGIRVEYCHGYERE